MTDNIFDRLFELFQTTDSVNWKLAEEITKSLAGSPEPIEPDLAEEYAELALPARLRLSERADFDVDGGEAPHPIDKAGWARENHRSYAYLIEPLSEAMGSGPVTGDPAAAMMSQLGPALLGMQAGSIAGFLSHRVMGQFDTALPPLDGRRPYLVVPNVEEFAAEHDLDARQVRLWATLHELVQLRLVTKSAVRELFTSRLREIYEGLDFDPTRLMEKLNRLQDPSQIEGMLSETGGLAALLGGDSRPEQTSDLTAAAAFVEGYGDYLVRLAGADLLSELARIEEAHGVRRTEPNQALEQPAQVIGLDIDRSRAGDAAQFCAEISRRWGSEALSSVVEAPERLPRLAELTDPVGWAARVLLE